MTDQGISPRLAALKSLEAALHDHRSAVAAPCAAELPAAGMPLRFPFNFTLPWMPSRRFVIVLGSCAGVIILAMSLVWWRLMSGPISLDIATPWLTAAIEENFGGRRHIEVGGTQLERDENGRTALRIRDIVVRDADGTVVASAPGAEVGFSGRSLLGGRIRAERLSLVGAQLAVRIEENGQLTVFAGADKRPFATAAAATGAVPAVVAPPVAPTGAPQASAQRSGVDNLLAALAWIDGLSAAGLDGYELDEIGIKNGNVAIDDQRNGKQWAFNKINLSLTRSQAGELSLSLGSDDPERPWQLLASAKPVDNGHRLINVEGRKVPLGDIMVATRVLEGPFEVDVPVSVTLRAQIGPDGVPERATGRVLVDSGAIGRTGSALGRVAIERAEFSLDWDAQRRVVAVPFQILAGGNRFTLFVQAEAPREPGLPWMLGMTGGTIVLGPLSATENEPLVANRVLVRGRFDPAKKRLEVDQGDIAAKELGVAFSGSLDYSVSDPIVAVGLAASNMTATSLKQSWPPFFNPKLRMWVLEHLLGGGVERVDISARSPLSHMVPGGPPMEGISVLVRTKNATIRPVDELPAIRDGDFVASIVGKVAKVELGRGTVELPSGRKLTMSGGLFEIADLHTEPKMSRTRFRVEGPMPAVAELLAFERLRDASDIPLDPATTRGNVTAQAVVGIPVTGEIAKGSVSYNIAADIANFSVDRFVMGQKVEGAALKVTATHDGYLLKGDVRIGGTPAAIEFRKTAGDGDPEIRLQTTLDDAARNRLGFDLYGTVKGPLGVKLAGRMATGDAESRYAVEADLTQAKVDNLLPGWTKPAGRSARAAFNMTSKGKAARFDDLLVEGSGVVVRGAVETDANGDLVAASFPVFALSDGDKASLKAERANDSTLKVTMRGDVFDGRNFVKAQMAGPTADQRARQTIPDLDVDLKLAAVAGFNGEAVRGLDVRMSRRAGEIRSLSVNGRLGVDTPLVGDLRGRGGGRQVIYMETADAGALFRFTDTYPRIHGGKMWVTMDPPSANQAPQDGMLNIQNFSVRGEPALERVATTNVNGPAGAKAGVDFSRMYVEFTRQPGKLSLREGVVRGPVIGATIDGNIDYTRDEVRMRGTFVPLYGLNNMFGQIPIVGLILGGGDKEGLVGITYEVVGPPGSPTLRVNPISAVAPGLLRKVFEFPSASDRSFSEPTIR